MVQKRIQRPRVGWSFLIAGVFVASCDSFEKPAGDRAQQNTASLANNPSSASAKDNKRKDVNMVRITSPAFQHNADIPRKYTCEGEDVSPPLSFDSVPAGTKSLALVVDDPDAPDPAAPKVVWVHWILFNIPPTTKSLAEGISDLPSGTGEGINDWKQTGYRGPCPPIGKHRYFHKLYALDTVLDLQRPNKRDLEHAMKGHVLAESELVGKYKKGK